MNFFSNSNNNNNWLQYGNNTNNGFDLPTFNYSIASPVPETVGTSGYGINADAVAQALNNANTTLGINANDVALARNTSSNGGYGIVPPAENTWNSIKTGISDTADSVNGFVNNSLGGWGNVFQGIQALGNLYGGFKQLGMMQDQLDLARDSFNFNKALTTQNLANQVKSYNTSLADRYRARAFTETGNANAYDKQIEERKLNSKI